MTNVWEILEKEQFTDEGIEHFEKVYEHLSKIFENATFEDIDVIYDALTDEDSEIVYDIIYGIALEKKGRSFRYDIETDKKIDSSKVIGISMDGQE